MAYKPLIIRDAEEIVVNPREDFLEESKQKIIGKKGIIVKGFETEKERIERYIKEKEFCNIFKKILLKFI